MIRRILTTCFALGTVLAAMAQVQTNTGGQGGGGVSVALVGAGGFIGGMVGGPSTATGHPYSAQQQTEHVQTLADGTKITQPPQIVVYYRDSLGRTRTERHMQGVPGLPSPAPPPVFIDINDPVAGYRYNLEPNSHVAHRVPFGPVRPNGASGNVARIVGNVPPPPPPPPPTVVSGLSTSGALYTSAGRPLQTGNSAPGGASVPRPEISREKLGTQIIEGVQAEGTKMTTTYPVGFFGNDRPITTVSETWFSRDLGLTVLTKTSDPRSGETTMRLTNIVQAEPDASLFQIPADYQVEDSSSPGSQPAR